MDYCMVGFVSTHAAITAQRLLEEHFPIRTMPILREVSAGCGIAVRFSPQHLAAARTILAVASLPDSEYAFYGVTGSGKDLTATIV